jgi:hypothetical protein
VLHDILAFSRSLWDEWVSIATGSGLLALVWLLERTAQLDVPTEWNWLIVSFTFMAAAFLSWRRQWIAAGCGFHSVKPQELISLRKGRTSILSDTLLKPYMNKRIRVTGSLNEVKLYPPIGANAYLVVEGVLITVKAGPWKSRLFTPLPVGAEITLSGRITAVGHSAVELGGVEVERVVDVQPRD